MLKSIRDITGQTIDRVKLENLYSQRDALKKKKNGKKHRDDIKKLQDEIYKMMYIPEYITVTMESVQDYKVIYEKGFKFNGVLYKRLSCSASQARVSTVVFCDDSIRRELKRRLDNGRDMNHLLAPSKYNAYFGLYSSATKEVTKPRFCIVPDYCETIPVDVDFIIEKPVEEDDIIEPRTMDIEFNRFDGSGLISPQMAEQWGKDLGEDYTPCQFCIRYAFTKGMVNEFDFVEWCRDENNGNYIIKDIYRKERDLREIDVILTEGQVKLWDSWDSQESLEKNGDKNGIYFGVTKYTPKEDKKVLTMNYQFLQTLNLNDDDINSLCKDTVNYLQGVSIDNIYYTLLYLMGEDYDREKIGRFMRDSDNYWIKTLILNNSMLNDRYTRDKIRDLIIRRIELACLGKINCEGNFSVIVPDSYGLMQWITGQRVTGLLRDGEFYMNYWAQKEEERIACARSPMTHFSEWYIARNKYKLDSEYKSKLEEVYSVDFGMSDEEIVSKIKKYFRYSYTGMITNIHGIYTMNFSGSDFDMDIAANLVAPEVINGKFPNQRVVTYQPKKPHKKLFTEDDLFVTDTFSFGTRIGQITNCSTTFCAMIPMFPEGSKERVLLEDRVKACCGAQSRQIDKTKIGENVKAEASIWKQYQHHDKDETLEEKERKDFYNRLLTDKRPYFFKYKYSKLQKEVNEFVKLKEEDCEVHLKMTLNELFKIPVDQLTEDQRIFLECYWKKYPLVDSDCVMNKICKHIEKVDFHIKSKIRTSSDFDYRELLIENFSVNKKLYQQISELVKTTLRKWEELKSLAYRDGTVLKVGYQEQLDKEVQYANLKRELENLCSNSDQLASHMVYLFYVDRPTYNKNILWGTVGKEIYEIVKAKTKSFYYPMRNENGTLEYLYDKFSIERFLVEDLKEDTNQEEDGVKVEND